MSVTERVVGQIDGHDLIVVDRDSQQATRKGWASLASIRGRVYELGDGRYIRVRAFEDIDLWEQSRGSTETGGEAEGPRREADMSPEAVAERAAQKARQAEAMAYVSSYRGSWGLILDIRADRRWGTKHLKLSDRQVEVILRAKARDEEQLEMARINSEIAYAEEYEEAQHARPTTSTAPELAAQPTPGQAPSSPVTAGVYRLPDGTVAKVQLAVHGSGKLYAKQLNLDTGDFEYVPGLISRVRAEHRMTVEEAGAFGKLYGRCMVCGRTLTDEVSIADGIGPVCKGRV